MLLAAVSTCTLLILLVAANPSSLLADDNKESPHTYFIPILAQAGFSAKESEEALSMVNQKRSEAGIPPVAGSKPLAKRCFEHARYMAENNILAHEQNPDLPFASENGESCARNGNTWLGSNYDWTPEDTIEGWMESVPHRLWLLYPTTRTVGYGFYSTPAERRAAAAVDVLSFADFAADEAYSGWPVIYPSENSTVPAKRYAVTLNWRYFGPAPLVEATQLRTTSGQVIAHDVTTALPAHHKGIQLLPHEDLPPQSKIEVVVSGVYEGQSFKYTWSFYSGS